MTPPCFYLLGDDIRAPRRTLAGVVNGETILGCLLALIHAVVTNDAGNTKPVVFEDLGSPLGLTFAVLSHIAPRRNGGFTAEQRQRQDLAFLGQALETFDRDEAVDSLQDRLQFRSDVKGFMFMLRIRPDFEDHGYHWHLLIRRLG